MKMDLSEFDRWPMKNKLVYWEIEYTVWRSMRDRCYNVNHTSYKYYGAKGITVCEEWLHGNAGYKQFKADLGSRPSLDYTLDRIDVLGNYEPSNCRWATWIEQANNKTNSVYYTYKEKSQTLSQWSRDLNISRDKLRRYIDNHGRTLEQAIRLVALDIERKKILNETTHNLKRT